MAIDAYGNTATSATAASVANTIKNKTKLSNDDFMTLLLVELQNQDPTNPTDTESILSQTSELASLESSDKTNTTLKQLSASLESANNFSSIAAIGKTADLGNDTISHTKGEDTTFDLYFPSDIDSGDIKILDASGNTVQTLEAKSGDAGVYTYSWDGKDASGNEVDEGLYHVEASYNNSAGDSLTTKVGTYPIESIKFKDGAAYAKVASGYVALSDIAEIY